MRTVHCLLTPAMCAWLAACDTPGPSPTTPTPAAVPILSGVVSETVGGVSRPLPGRPVHLWLTSVEGPGGRAQSVTTDETGRYVVTVGGGRVFANAWHPPDQQQPCLASAVIGKDTTLDVEVMPAGSAPPSLAGAHPLVTGYVYEHTPHGRTPVRDAYAVLDAVPFIDVPVATTQTDDDGRFLLCRVNAPVGLAVGGYGYQASYRLLPGTGDVTVEIELQRQQ